MTKTLITTLANVKDFYERLHGFHWNVEGKDFQTYHQFFAELYAEVYESIDDLAEQIRTLDEYVPYASELSEKSTLPTMKNIFGKDIETMLQQALVCNEIVINGYEKCVKENIDNSGLVDYLTSRINAHQKIAWKIKSSQK